MEGTQVYFPKSAKNASAFYTRRNDGIRRMYHRLKKLGLNDLECYTEIQLRYRLASKLTVDTIRAIVKGYHRYAKGHSQPDSKG